MILRLRAWLIERLGGELPDDWGVDWRPAKPDYYDEDGNAVYDMTKRLRTLQAAYNEVFVTMLEHSSRFEPQIDWMADDGS